MCSVAEFYCCITKTSDSYTVACNYPQMKTLSLRSLSHFIFTETKHRAKIMIVLSQSKYLWTAFSALVFFFSLHPNP